MRYILGNIILLLAEGGCGGATGTPVVEGKGGNCTAITMGHALATFTTVYANKTHPTQNCNDHASNGHTCVVYRV